jgi:hypothetical protein
MSAQFMNSTESPNGRNGPTTTQSRSATSSDGREAPAVQFNGALVRQKCPVCDDPVGENCFCKIHHEEEERVMLCCPSCVIQYIDLARPPADDAEKQLREYENNTHFFMAEDKWRWWS